MGAIIEKSNLNQRRLAPDLPGAGHTDSGEEDFLSQLGPRPFRN